LYKLGNDMSGERIYNIVCGVIIITGIIAIICYVILN